MAKYDLVDKRLFEAESIGKAKAKYIKMHTDSKYVDVLCRKSKNTKTYTNEQEIN